MWYHLKMSLNEDARFLARPLGLVRRGWNRRGDGLQWWKEDAPRRGLRGLDPDRILVVRVLADPAPEFQRLTGRGGADGWIVDTEVFWASKRQSGPDGQMEWVFHNERRAPDEATASQLCEQMKVWLDRHSIDSLLSVPRSGPLSMSKPPKAESSTWARLSHLVNG